MNPSLDTNKINVFLEVFSSKKKAGKRKASKTPTRFLSMKSAGCFDAHGETLFSHKSDTEAVLASRPATPI